MNYPSARGSTREKQQFQSFLINISKVTGLQKRNRLQSKAWASQQMPWHVLPAIPRIPHWSEVPSNSEVVLWHETTKRTPTLNKAAIQGPISLWSLGKAITELSWFNILTDSCSSDPEWSVLEPQRSVLKAVEHYQESISEKNKHEVIHQMLTTVL